MKVKVRLPLSTPCRYIEGSRCVATLVQHHSPVSFNSGKESRYPLNWRLGGPQTRFERFGEENNLPCGGFEPILQSLYRLHSAGACLFDRDEFFNVVFMKIIAV
jgi:hypothetical protein